jgi:hypothetical protein
MSHKVVKKGRQIKFSSISIKNEMGKAAIKWMFFIDISQTEAESFGIFLNECLHDVSA